MAKVLKTAALVIGAVALVVATAGALAPAFTSAALASVGITASATAIATVLTLTAAALSFGAALLTPKPRILGGDPTKWKADPFAGLPYWVGRTLNSGNIVRRITHGTNNKYETFVTVLSCAGPIQSIDTFFANRTTQAFDGSGNATGAYRNQIYQRMQLGLSPEPAALLSPVGGVPGMDGSSKLSGLAATAMTFAYDSKATIPFTAEVTPAWIGHGVKCYDPRLDSTYPGGAGPCRALDESTYVWSENPFVHAITWCIGRWQNGKRVIGLGAPIGAIVMSTMVAGANVADANNWKVGGVVYSRPDTPWTVLKAFLQAAAAIPVMVGGSISCMAETPRVSLATITSSDIVGEVSITATQSRRARINGVVPRYRSEAHDWQVVAGDLVQVADYVTIDGGERTKDVDYVLVQDVGQAAQLGRYEIENAREFGPVTVQLKPAWMNYRVGDCVTLAPREITPQKMLILSREVDPATGIVTFTMRSETDGKHAFALGQTGTAPPTATLNPYIVPATAPAANAWSVSASNLTSAAGTLPALVVTGAVEAANVDSVIFEYRVQDSSSWTGGSLETPAVVRKEITSVMPETAYEVAVSYVAKGMIGDRLVLGPVTTGAQLTPAGTPGPRGADGQTSYLHTAYADSADGSVNFTAGAPGARKYLGVLVDFTVSDSTNFADYTWSLIKGSDGLNGSNGTPGAPGANGQPSYVHIAYSNAADGSSGFSVDDPTGRTYVGFYSDFTLADSTSPAAYTWSLVKGADGRDGLNGTNGAPGAPGINGQASYLHVAYSDAADGSVNFTTGAPGARKYLGVLVDQTASDSTNAALYRWSLVKGADGLNGANGTPGAPGADGQPTYVHIAYSSAADGSVNFDTTNPIGRTYVGFYVDQVVADSTNPSAYAWSLVKGTDGANGSPGANGSDGISVTLGSYQLTIAADYLNATKGGQLPKTVSLKVLKGVADITGDVSVSLAPSAGILASYSSGVVSITQADAEGYIDATVTYLGTTLSNARIRLTRQQDALPPASQSSGSYNGSATISSNSFGSPLGNTILIKANTNGEIAISFSASYYAGGAVNSSVSCASAPAYRASGAGAWSYGSATNGSTAVVPDRGNADSPDPTPGTITADTIISGLTVGQVYEVGIAVRRSGGAATATLYGSGAVRT